MPVSLILESWQQSIDVIEPNPHHRMQTFPGLPPILVEQDQGLIYITQAGQATAWGKYYVAPAPLFPAALVEPKRITRSANSRKDGLYRTSWQYVMAVPQGTTIDRIAPTKWPTAPTFEEIT
jgi:hypothetical protein